MIKMTKTLYSSDIYQETYTLGFAPLQAIFEHILEES
jgi:hypothetical protein